MTEPQAPPASQPVYGAITNNAFFIVATIRGDEQSQSQVRAWCADVAGLARAVGKRIPAGHLSCVIGFGATAWDRLFGGTRPAGLHTFREYGSGTRVAVSTPGDLLIHIRAERTDLCFELATQLLGRLEGAIDVVDEVQGFRQFDHRSMVGFVDGTENPEGDDAIRATVIGAEDPDYAGGSYVLVQKYLHDMKGWNALPVEAQERIIGRTKLSDIELDDDTKPSWAHNALTVLEDEDGNEIKILRDNMPFGRPGHGEFGTYFIGYARSPAPVEQMLENMFVGVPPGNYDRLLDFSQAITGSLFFIPSLPLLDALSEREPEPSAASAAPDTAATHRTPDDSHAASGMSSNGTLNIGSLKGAPRHE